MTTVLGRPSYQGLPGKISGEFNPFDIGLAKDVHTAMQLAFSYETASIADIKNQPGDIWRDSHGLGSRVVTASGGVLRADLQRVMKVRPGPLLRVSLESF